MSILNYAPVAHFLAMHKLGDTYEMTNRNKTKELCKIAYFPLDMEEPTALIEINRGHYNDFREVPIRFLKKVKI